MVCDVGVVQVRNFPTDQESRVTRIQALWRGCMARCYVQQLLWLLAEKSLVVRHKIATTRHERQHRNQLRRKPPTTQTQIRRGVAVRGAYSGGAATARGYDQRGFEPSEKFYQQRKRAWAAPARSQDEIPISMDFGKGALQPSPESTTDNIEKVYNIDDGRDFERFKQLTPLSERRSSHGESTPPPVSPKIESKYAALPEIRSLAPYRRMHTLVLMNVAQNAVRVFKLLQKRSWLFKDNVHTTSAHDEALTLSHHMRFDRAQQHLQCIVAVEPPAGIQPAQPQINKSKAPAHRPYSWEGRGGNHIRLSSRDSGVESSTMATQTIFTSASTSRASNYDRVQTAESHSSHQLPIPRPPSSPKPATPPSRDSAFR